MEKNKKMVVTEQSRSVPELRFPNFEGNWIEKRLGNVLNITSSSRVHKDEWTKEGVSFFRSSDVVADFKGIKNIKAYISYDLYRALSKKTGRVKKGDLLITGGGSIGIPYLIKNNEPLYFKDADLLWIKTDNKVSGSFLYSYFTSQSFKKYIKSISHVGTIAHYTVVQAKGTPCHFPSLPEQQKIAAFLTAVDDKIQGLNRKKELLELYKKGVMQQLFNGKWLMVDGERQFVPPTLRFKPALSSAEVDENEAGELVEPPKWEEKKLGEVAEINPRNKVLPESFIYIDLESVEKGQLKKETLVELASAPSRAQRSLKPNDILYQMVRPYQKNNLLFLKQGTYVASTGYAQIRAHESPEFLYHVIHTDKFVNKVMSRCTGTSYPAINSNDLNAIKIPVPCFEEQQKIASFLSSIDQKIEQVGVQLDKAREWKKGLLQKMFV